MGKEHKNTKRLNYSSLVPTSTREANNLKQKTRDASLNLRLPVHEIPRFRELSVLGKRCGFLAENCRELLAICVIDAAGGGVWKGDAGAS